MEKNTEIKSKDWNSLAGDTLKLADEKKLQLGEKGNDAKLITNVSEWNKVGSRVTENEVSDLVNAMHQLEHSFHMNCCQENCCQQGACQSCQSCQRCQGQCYTISHLSDCTNVNCNWITDQKNCSECSGSSCQNQCRNCSQSCQHIKNYNCNCNSGGRHHSPGCGQSGDTGHH